MEGIDPLMPFGPNAAAHLLRHDGFAHTPDVLVNSLYDPDTEEVAAFEELVGSHGGLGGPQAHPFVVVPSEWRGARRADRGHRGPARGAQALERSRPASPVPMTSR